jgi:arylsulfatase A-like enzyme
MKPSASETFAARMYRSADLFVQLEKYHISRLFDGTTHGSPYDYDTHVPMVLVVPGIASQQITQRVHTVDLAPTLAALLGIPTPDDVDGIDRTELIENGGKSTTTN